MIDSVFSIVIAGVAACLVLDFWQQIIKRVMGIPASNFAVVGRWFLRIRRVKSMYQPTIDAEPPEPNELRVGWCVHYAVSVGYAVVFYAMMVVVPVFKPTFYFIPCMGKGMMARYTATPVKICAVALANHLVYGVAMAISMGLVV